MKIGFVSDIHEDAPSLADALTVLEQRGCDTVCCLGDITGFSEKFLLTARGRDRRECINLITAHCSYAIAGNHDLHTVKRVTSFREGTVLRDDWYSLSLTQRKGIAGTTLWLYEDELDSSPLTDNEIQFLNGLPETAIISAPDCSIMLTHFLHPDLSGSTRKFPAKETDISTHLAMLDEKGCAIGFSGHGHPEGVALGSAHRLEFRGFGMYPITDSITWIDIPAVVASNRRSGVAVFDTGEMMLEVIELLKQPRQTTQKHP